MPGMDCWPEAPSSPKTDLVQTLVYRLFSEERKRLKFRSGPSGRWPDLKFRRAGFRGPVSVLRPVFGNLLLLDLRNIRVLPRLAAGNDAKPQVPAPNQNCAQSKVARRGLCENPELDRASSDLMKPGSSRRKILS
jgi:hypothetical protein